MRGDFPEPSGPIIAVSSPEGNIPETFFSKRSLAERSYNGSIRDAGRGGRGVVSTLRVSKSLVRGSRIKV